MNKINSKRQARSQERAEIKKEKEYTQLIKDVEQLKKMVAVLQKSCDVNARSVRALKSKNANLEQTISRLQHQLSKVGR